MPSGKTHARLDFVVLLILLGAAFSARTTLVAYFGYKEFVAIAKVFVVSYMLGSLLLSPDMDLNASGPMKNWGVLRFLWRPYTAMFKHRGLSHVPVFGTMTRICYLFLVAFAVGEGVQAVLGRRWEFSWESIGNADRGRAIWALAGMVLPDLCHICADRAFGLIRKLPYRPKI
ncbi:MAG: DUF2227 family putative metal-binding protein [bacterium]|nr:DUF2227 family putative metal-binding protein [bacterium]